MPEPVDDIFRGSVDVAFSTRGLGGRPHASCDGDGSSVREIHLFGRYSAAVVNGVDDPPDLVPFRQLLYLSENSGHERLFLVSTRTISVIRNGTNLSPLQPSRIKGRSVAGGEYTERGVTPLVMELSRHLGGQVRYGDLGQDHEVWATGVYASLLVPSTWAEVVNASDSSLQASGNVYDSIVQFSIQPIEVSRGGNAAWMYTQNVAVASDDPNLFLEIPPGARHAQVWERSGTALASVSLEWIGSNIPGLPIPLTNAQSERVYVADATHMRFPSAVETDRQFTVVWEIWP